MDPGTKLGHYEILGPLGAGGMGEVYRARDTNLKREVAIKVLPQALAADQERLARLEREAHLLAALNHVNIASIHSLERDADTRFLVLELVEGETLAERLKRGALPVEEALEAAKQIAEAVEAAHEKGIIHRDLKPANVMMTPTGNIKVLDFGLAKGFEVKGAEGDATHSPTITVAATKAGVIQGTAAYMSPEQARGQALDKRTDIWAFGCVLYEMLSGRMAFGTATVSDTLAAILEHEPGWNSLPKSTPATVQLLLHRCLQKDPHGRLRDIGDARIEIEEVLSGSASGMPGLAEAVVPPPLWRRAIPWGMAGLMVIVAAAAIYWGMTPSGPQGVTRLPVALPPGVQFATAGSAVAISPDGAHIVYVAVENGNQEQLYLRSMDQLEDTLIPDTEGGRHPFLSPDGQWIGFWANRKLWRAPLSGGTPLPICDAPALRGASWGPDDTIIFAPGIDSGLVRVSAAGGEPEVLTTLDSESGELSHRWPQVLPGGEAVIFTVHVGGSFDDSLIAVLSLETGGKKILPVRGTDPQYVPTGHLLYGRAGSLVAVPFDLDRLEVAGPQVPVLDDLWVLSDGPGEAKFSVSDAGSLAYIPEPPTDSELVLVDRKGEVQLLGAPARAYGVQDDGPRFSPDGGRLAVGADKDVWIYDLQRGTLSLFTTAASNENTPLWTPDGKRIAFLSDRTGVPNLFWKPADGSGAAEQLLQSRNWQKPNTFSPDGRVLLYQEQSPITQADIWVLPLDGDRTPTPLIRTDTNSREAAAAFSPNGRWLAYNSNESGRYEVYVVPYPGAARKVQISTGGGSGPVWAPDGRELFYRSGDTLMGVAVTAEPDFTPGIPRPLFSVEYRLNAGVYPPAYDISPDGQSFVFMRPTEETPHQWVLVQNWFEELKQRVPTGR